MTRPVRIGIIGLGMAAEPHALALRAMGDKVEIAAAYSPTPARRAAFGERHAVPVTASAAAILEDRSIGLVLILTPPNTHLDLVAAAACAGKNIILEKPLEISLERAEAVVDICAPRGHPGRGFPEPLSPGEPLIVRPVDRVPARPPRLRHRPRR